MEIKTKDVEYVSYSTKEWIVDFNVGTVGEPESNLQSIAQDIQFILSTERFKYPIMGGNFGVVFDDLIGTDYNFIRSEIKRRIIDALSVDDRITDASEFEFSYNEEDSSIHVNCNVYTVLGEVPISLDIRQ